MDCACTGIVYENSLRRLTRALPEGYWTAWHVLLNKYAMYILCTNKSRGKPEMQEKCFFLYGAV